MRTALAKLDRLEEQVEARTRAAIVAVTLESMSTPEWADRLDAGRIVVLIGGDQAEQRRALTRLRKEPDAEAEGVIRLDLLAGASEGVLKALSGEHRELAEFASRPVRAPQPSPSHVRV